MKVKAVLLALLIVSLVIAPAALAVDISFSDYSPTGDIEFNLYEISPNESHFFGHLNTSAPVVTLNNNFSYHMEFHRVTKDYWLDPVLGLNDFSDWILSHYNALLECLFIGIAIGLIWFFFFRRGK